MKTGHPADRKAAAALARELRARRLPLQQVRSAAANKLESLTARRRRRPIDLGFLVDRVLPARKP